MLSSGLVLGISFYYLSSSHNSFTILFLTSVLNGISGLGYALNAWIAVAETSDDIDTGLMASTRAEHFLYFNNSRI